MKKFLLRNFDWENGVEDAMRDLLAGKHRHDVLENAVRVIELEESADTVGFGGFPNLKGEMELDAAFMNGETRSLGAVASVKRQLPVRIARRLMERNTHVLLTGEGAELFARECGLEDEPVLSSAQKDKWQRDVKPRLDKCPPGGLMDLVMDLAEPHKKKEFDTVVMIASDGTGLSAATSTSGWPYKFPGRVGDTPVAGAGFYVDSAYGGCLCTYTGEMAVRAGMARQVVSFLASGRPVREAVDQALEDLARLQTGLLRGLCIHAIDHEGNERVVAVDIDSDDTFVNLTGDSSRPVRYQYWREGMAHPECRAAEAVKL